MFENRHERNQVLRHRGLCVALLLTLFACAPASANTYLVTNTNDSGTFSLRDAITQANANPGADTIVFSIGSGAQTISPATPLPVSTGPVTFDGWQQMGFSGTPLIRIDGNSAGAGAIGLRIDAGPSTVQGLIITRFTTDGLQLNGGSGNVVKGCYLGTDGSAALGNAYNGLTIYNANFSTIGGSLGKDANVISGNAQNGVFLDSSAHDISFYGNRIGTNAAGTAAIANAGYGMRLFAANSVIGNALASTRNIVSGNSNAGIYIEHLVSGTQILGAYIGLNAAGTAALPNGGDGITDRGSESLIGDVTPGGGNVISGNTYNGITVIDADGSQYVNNLIGTDPAGTVALPNQQYGIRAIGGGFINIGTSAAGAGNLISGNGNYGVIVEAAATIYSVVGNRIGTNLAGTAALANAGDGVSVYGQSVSVGNASAGNLLSGNTGNGISIADGAQDVTVLNNTIGLNAAGTAALANGQYGVRALGGSGIVLGQAGDGNVISGNARGVILESPVEGATVQGNTIGLSANQTTYFANNDAGIEILGANNQIGGTGVGDGNVIGRNALYGVFLAGPAATGNHIEGNIIGTNTALTGNFPNLFGVVIYGASGNFIGGTAAGSGNVIANSPNMGIYNWFGSQNRFLGNRIYNNGALGIDLDPQGPLPNDPLDADHGPNEGQNFPVVTLATSTAGSVSIGGQFGSEPNANYRIEYFVSLICPGSGLGVGENYIGFQNVTTDADGLAMLAKTIPTALVTGYVTATATSADGNTSEFSPCIAIGPASAGQFDISRNPVLAYEDFGVVHVAVVRSQGLTGAVSVHFKTADGSATAPSDYGAVDQVLSFADGETIQLVDVPIVLDNNIEGTEHFSITLSQPTGGAFLGSQASVDVTLIDHDPAYPVYTVGDATVPEPLAGQAQVMVAVKLSAATNHAVTLSYSTQDASAKAGQDYVSASGPVVFAAGETIKLVPVTVLANGASLSDRVFYLLIGGDGAQQVYAGDSEGEIVILGGDRIFKNGFD